MDKAAKDAPLAFKFDIKSLVNHELILRVLCTWPTKQATHKRYIQVVALSRAP